MNDRPTATFVGVTYAGWSTRQRRLERHVIEDGRLEATFHDVDGWKEGGALERLPLPPQIAGRLRSTLEARALGAVTRPDIVWTSAPELLLPFLPMFRGPWRRPLVVELDWTARQRESMAPEYFGRPGRSGAALRRLLARERLIFSHVSLFGAMSTWAAEGLRDVGVDADRIAVVHPGCDLDDWVAHRRSAPTGRLRLLFVGGDFVRKGGDLLLRAISGRFAGRAEIDVVTRDEVEPTDGVVVHRCEPGSTELKDLYATADLFVMPTRADCYGHAVVEALSSGLPVIAGDVGGVGDLVVDGETGWTIEPTLDELLRALEEADRRRDQLPAMGAAARRFAEEHLDGRRNDRRLIDLMLGLCEQRADTSSQRVPG